MKFKSTLESTIHNLIIVILYKETLITNNVSIRLYVKELLNMAKKIVLDAGHALGLGGNRTPDGIDEWTLNNKVALAVAKQLANYEVEVYRVDDITGKTDIALYERVSRTNKIAPDVFISIHHNAYTSKWGTWGGVEVFYNLSRQNATEKSLASEISAALAANTGLTNRGVKTAAFTVLTNDSKIISLLTEGGFMDSTVDHPVITSAKGQEGYAKAISDELIKLLKLTKKTGGTQNTTTTTTSNIKVDDKYTLNNNTPGYYTAEDALAGKNQRVNVLAGEYYVYRNASGMLNITKSKGYAGSWINPAKVTSTTTTTTTSTTQQLIVDSKITLKNNALGYNTAADAKDSNNPRVTVLAGEYTIYKIANGMVNITKIKGQAGSWINPDKVSFSTTNTTSSTSINTTQKLVAGGGYTLKNNMPGYYTAADAIARKNQKVTLLAGEYTIYKIANGMINLTKVKGQAGSWINPA